MANPSIVFEFNQDCEADREEFIEFLEFLPQVVSIQKINSSSRIKQVQNTYSIKFEGSTDIENIQKTFNQIIGFREVRSAFVRMT